MPVQVPGVPVVVTSRTGFSNNSGRLLAKSLPENRIDQAKRVEEFGKKDGLA